MSEQAKATTPTSEEVVKLFDLVSLEVFFGFNLRTSLLQCTREEFDTIYRVFERAQAEREGVSTTSSPKLGDANEHP